MLGHLRQVTTIYSAFQSTPQQTTSRRHIVRVIFYFIISGNINMPTTGRLAIKFHPDKNRDDPNAEERFKEIAIAYQTLSDPTLRKKYNEFGSKESAPEGGFVDPEEVFGAIFGGERFVPIIGHISLAKDMKAALQEAEEGEDEEGKPVLRDAKGREIVSPEEKSKREEKARKVAAEVRASLCIMSCIIEDIRMHRKRQLARNGYKSLLEIWRGN